MNAAYTASPVFGFFRARWNGDISLPRLFWWDTLAVATLVNAIVAMFSMILLAKGIANTGLWLLLHVTLLPYNIFLVSAIWRNGQSTTPIRTITLAWFLLTVLV